MPFGQQPSTEIRYCETINLGRPRARELDALWKRYTAAHGPMTKHLFLRHLHVLGAAQVKTELDAADPTTPPNQEK